MSRDSKMGALCGMDDIDLCKGTNLTSLTTNWFSDEIVKSLS